MTDPAPAAGEALADLRTERLRLVALTRDLARTAVEDREGLQRELGARVPPAWPGADFARMLPSIARASGAFVAAPTRLIVHAGDRSVIGEAGFHGPPDGTGTVEFGYSIVPEYRGRGFASEAARAVIRNAFTITAIRCVVAECLEDNRASLRVLEKLGMRRIGSAGDIVRFELRRV